jgi:hypothetical protein
VTVLYGNQRDAGPSAGELALLRRAGLDDAAITAAMTTVPLAFWGIDATGTHLELDRDPRRDATALLHARAVYIHGVRVR